MRIRLAILGLILALMTLTPALSLAQEDAETIEYGDTFEGRIRNSDTQHWYVFEGRRGDEITISAESDDTDVYIQLGNEELDLLAENDDISQNNLNALIEDFELPESGTYYILVRAYDRGNYTLTLEEGRSGGSSSSSSNNSNSSSGSEDVTELEYGDTVEGEAIDLETPIVYTFSGRAGDTVTISVTSDEIDPYAILADINGDTIAENDDIEKNNLNSYIEAVLPANGDYLIGVFGYTAGPFTLELNEGDGGGTTPVVETQDNEEILSGEITDREYFAEFPIEGVNEGDTISIETRATSGDLDLYIGLFQGEDLVAENDDREQGTFDAALEYAEAAAGDYSVIVTRYGFEEGNTEGEFELSIKVSGGGGGIVADAGDTVVSNPVAAGYPVMNPTPSIAEWTVLVYMGADNNLEDGLINDLDEFERAGGSNDRVRIVALIDRAPGFDRSNGNWTDTRLFEVGRDRTGDAAFQYPPTIDTREIASLGELDTSYGQNLLDFLVWGIQTYPAQRYAISLNDHGGAWSGIVTDDTTGRGILNMPELQAVFQGALQQTGIDRFDLLINDACLMSSVEYYAAMSPYFDYVISSPEITLNPSFDMDLLTRALNRDPEIPIPDLGRLLVDKYMQDMQQLSPDTAPVLGAAVTDLREMGTVVEAMDNFAAVFNAQPQAYVSLFGQVRSNTYTYSFFLPEDQFGPATNIDLGSFMQGVVDNTRDEDLRDAAEDVLRSLNDIRLYATAGQQLDRFSSYYNIYFPSRSSDFQSNYFQENPLESWSLVLRNYFGNVSAGGGVRGVRAPAGGVQGAPPLSPVDAPSIVPEVTITNLFPAEGNANVPFKVGMEVTGRNISQGIFTVDQIQPDGSSLRLDSSLIVTTVVEDGVADRINFWAPGVDDFTFTWNVELSMVSDGQTSDFELVLLNDDIYSLAGRYHPPGSDEWVDVTLIFGDDNRVSSAVSRQEGTNALASIRLEEGGEFQTYRSIVSPDGIVQTQPGTTYQWTEDGLSWSQEPAPEGEYNLGFLIEAFGGATGFNSTRVTVNNDGVNPETVGYLDTDWGFLVQRPDDFSAMDYFPDGPFLQASKNGEEYLFVYPVFEVDDPEDLESIARQALDPFGTEYDRRFEEATYGDKDGLEFTYTYTNGDDDEFAGRGFVIYLEDLELGLVFASEALDEDRTDELFELMLNDVVFFDPAAWDEGDTGRWQRDTYDADTRYSVPTTWMPGGEREDTGSIWFYSPDDDSSSPIFAAVTAYPDREDTAEDLRDAFIETYVEDLRGFEVVDSETYYGENETWEVTTYRRNGFVGRVYTSIGENDTGYVWWFEAPEDEFNDLFDTTFRVMVDSFNIEVED